jgi:hypothetical protein
MNSNELLNDIRQVLKAIVDKTDEINGANVSRIDVDIIKEDIRKLYEQYNQLNQNINIEPEVIKEPKKKTVKEPEVKAPEKIEIKEQIKEEIIIEKEPEIILSKPAEVIAEKEVVEKKPEPKPASSDLFSLSENNTIADRFKDEKNSINEKMAQGKADISIADKLKHTKTNDIKSLIGINEKFQMINELFEGYTQNYNDFITKLNTFSNLDEANNYIIEQKEIRKWKDELQSLGKLKDLIENRYS